MIHRSAFTLPHDNSGHVALYHWQDGVSGRPVLHWAHANGFNGHTYVPLLNPLAEHLTFSMGCARAWSHCYRPCRKNDRLGYLWRDLIALIEHLADKHGRKIWLGGHSMGGFTSVFAAAERPDLVAGLVLADPVIVRASAR